MKTQVNNEVKPCPLTNCLARQVCGMTCNFIVEELEIIKTKLSLKQGK